MFETSRDVLNLVAAVSIATLVFFLCWALFYVISSARRTFRLIKRVEQGVEKAESLIELVKEKISSSAAYLPIINNLIKKGMEFAENRRQSKEERADNLRSKVKKSKDRK